MTDYEKRKQMTDILKGIRFSTMDEGKSYLHNILKINTCGPISFNALMSALGKNDIRPEYGFDWGWKDLGYELLSNKYGIAAVRDYKNKKTEFLLRLPPPEPMHIQTEVELHGCKSDME